MEPQAGEVWGAGDDAGGLLRPHGGLEDDHLSGAPWGVRIHLSGDDGSELGEGDCHLLVETRDGPSAVPSGASSVQTQRHE